MRVLICIATFVLTALTASAAAQPTWTMPGGNTYDPPRTSMTGHTSADRDRCTHWQRVYEPAESLESCNRLIGESRSRSTDAELYWHRAMRYQDAGQTEEYLADLNRARELYTADIEANPRDYDGYTNRASVLARLENYDAALVDYERAAALDSDASHPHLGRGVILFRRGDYTGAQEAFDRAARIAARTNTSSWRIHAYRCEVRAAQRSDLDRAGAFCERAVRNAQRDTYARTSRGYLHFMQGDLESAAADFSRAAAEDRFNAGALYGRGVIAARQGRTAEGQADIARAREIDAQEVSYYAGAGLTP